MDNQNGGIPNPNYPDQPAQPTQTPHYPNSPIQNPNYTTPPPRSPGYTAQPTQFRGYSAAPAAWPVAAMPAKRGKTKFFIIIGAIVAIIIGIVVCAISCSLSNNPKDVVKKYIEASYINVDLKTAESYCALSGDAYYRTDSEYWYYDNYYEHLSDHKASNYEEYCDYENSKTKDKLQGKYGENINISFKEVSEEELTNSEKKEIKNLYKEKHYLTVTDARKVIARYEITGSEGNDYFKEEFIVVKIDGKWKISNG